MSGVVVTTLRDEDIRSARRAPSPRVSHEGLERAVRREQRRHEVLELSRAAEPTHIESEPDEALAAE